MGYCFSASALPFPHCKNWYSCLLAEETLQATRGP